MKLRLQNLLPISLWIPLFGSAAIALPVMFGENPNAVPNVFTSGTPALASEVNDNFQSLSDRLVALEQTSGVVCVATTGGDFNSVADGVAEASSMASAGSPILVRIAPGIYDETEQIVISPFVHVQGSGSGVTTVRGARSGSLNAGDTSVVFMSANAALSDIRIENSGASTGVASAIVVSTDAGTSRVRDVVALVDAPGSSRAIGISLLSARPLIDSCDVRARGASTFNQALTANASGNVQARLRNCQFIGEGSSEGMGVYLNGSSARLENCTVIGGLIGVSVEDTGSTRIIDCLVGTGSSSPSLAQSGNARIDCKGVEFNGGNAIGTASLLRYAHCVRSNFSVVVNGAGSSIN